MSLAALRSQLALVVAPPPVAADLLPTGVAGLDAALGGGLPRGRLTEIAGPLGSGTATLARRLVTGLVARGLGVAYVDAARTLDPADWAHLAAGHLRVVRPPDAARGAWCADVLLRSGAFVLVVLDGAPPLTRQQALRLVGLAREKDAAFVVVGRDRPSAVSGAVRLALRRRWGGGRRGSVERGVDTVRGANTERGVDTGHGAGVMREAGARHGANVKRGADAGHGATTERGANTWSLRGASAASDAAIPVHRSGVLRTFARTPFRCTGIVRPSASPARAARRLPRPLRGLAMTASSASSSSAVATANWSSCPARSRSRTGWGCTRWGPIGGVWGGGRGSGGRGPAMAGRSSPVIARSERSERRGNPGASARSPLRPSAGAPLERDRIAASLAGARSSQ